MFDLMTKEAVASVAIDLDLGGTKLTRRSGLLHSTRLATRAGWREVESLAVGDEVLTFDSGFQPVTAIERVINWPDQETCPDHVAPFEIPAGVLGNHERVCVLPNQLVVVESDLAEELTGDPFALVPVDVLDGWLGIQRVLPRAPHEVVAVHFAQDQVVYAGDGALLHVQADASILDTALGTHEARYQPLERPIARLIADDLKAKSGRNQ
ncbi:MAG: Hint domain-containing protein [Pseudomonadota bacterium]